MGRFKPPSAKADVDQRLDPVVLKSLEREPADRYQSAGEVKDQVAGLNAIPVGRPGPAAVKESPDSFKQWASMLATMGVVSLPAGIIMAFNAGGTTAKMMVAGSSLLLIAALVVWLIGLAKRHFDRPRMPEPFSEKVAVERAQIRGCLLFLLIGVLGFLALIALLMWPASERRPPQAVVTAPAPPAVTRPQSTTLVEREGPFSVDDVLTMDEKLPPEVDEEAVRMQAETLSKGLGFPPDVSGDLEYYRTLDFRDGRAKMLCLQFKTEFAWRRWRKDPAFLNAVSTWQYNVCSRGLGLILIYHDSSPAGEAAGKMLESLVKSKLEARQPRKK
jgi:hypothetical protein